MTENVAIVIDNGSNNSKIGIAGVDEEMISFPTVIGHKRIVYINGVCYGMKNKDYYVGNEAQLKRGMLSINYPIERGIIKNWDDMEKIWFHSFYNQLHIAPEEHTMFHCEIPISQTEQREKITEIMFETFITPSMYIDNTAVLSMYSTGRNCGISLEFGDGITSICPINNGKLISNTLSKSINLSGCHLTDYMCKLLNERGITTVPSISNLKDQFSYISLNFENEIKNTPQPVSYELPDGQIITIGNERFICPELLFQPSLNNIESKGIHEMFFDSIIKCDVELRDTMYSNINLSGGTSMIPGISNRLHKELSLLAPSNVPINIISSPNRKHSAWAGGSMFSSISTFQQLCISKYEYDEFGPSIVGTKCPTI